ncbi:MAG: hypothetical protein ABL977_07780 [Candidatus Eisenbacteria bacterium]
MLREGRQELTPEELLELVAEVVTELEQRVASTESSEAEREILTRGGFERMPDPAGKRDPLVQTAASFAAIRRASLSVAELAEVLGVNASRVRQRLGEQPPSLYGFKHGGAWQIPEFLMHGAELVPGVDKVCARLATGMHPVAFYRWFTTPNPDLVEEGGEEHALAPRSWLLAGHDPEPVARLAEEL